MCTGLLIGRSQVGFLLSARSLGHIFPIFLQLIAVLVEVPYLFIFPDKDVEVLVEEKYQSYAVNL